MEIINILTSIMSSSIPIFIAIIAAISVLGGYVLQRRNELKLKIVEQKKIAYMDFLVEFAVGAIPGRETTVTEKLLTTRTRLMLYAGDNVVKAFANWTNHRTNVMRQGDDVDKKNFGNLLLEIRKDVLGKTDLTNEEVKALYTIHY